MDVLYFLEAVAFRKERGGKHGTVVEVPLAILRGRFACEEKIEGNRKYDPVALAEFELGEGDEQEQQEARALRQREASDVVEQLIVRIGQV